MKSVRIKRKAYNALLEWKSTMASRYALLVEGARRVGKTYLIKDFIQKEYDSSIYIDFSQKSALSVAARKAFSEEDDVTGVLERLSIIYGVRLVPGRSCIVFDEVQRFPQAREMIKGFMEHGKYHFIESGSLVGIKENTKEIVIPSEEHSYKLHPFDFEEFLIAMGEDKLLEVSRESFFEMKPMLDDFHKKAMRLFRLYMIVGGMPQALLAYLEGDDDRLNQAELAKREILALYDRDIGKYASGYASKVRAVFKMIPSALNTREKKFRLGNIDSSARMRRYENAFLWLSDAMLVNIAYNSESPDVGLGMNLENTLFKCYSLDTGLLVTQSFTGSPEVDSRLLRGVLYDNLGVNEGMFFENAIAQALVANGNELFFYTQRNKEEKGGVMEIDFLFRNGIKISPLEVKSAQYRRHASLDRFIGAFSRRLGGKYVVCGGNLEVVDGIIYLPAYMAHLIGEKGNAQPLL